MASELMRNDVECTLKASMGLATVLSAVIGYVHAAEVAKEALEKGKTLVEVVEEKGFLSKEELREILDPTKMTEPETRF